jgi:asparagine synthetase B (glutamine-hydrolysing)
MWHDLRCYLPGLLHVEDRTSMAASIESRTPLLDYRLVELALRMPTDVIFSGRDPKPVLRRAVSDWLPPAVAQRRDKKGFPTPLHWWQERPALRELVYELGGQPLEGAARRFPGNASEVHPVFAPSYLAGLQSMQASELWTVLSVNGWRASLAADAFATPARLQLAA